MSHAAVPRRTVNIPGVGPVALVRESLPRYDGARYDGAGFLRDHLAPSVYTPPLLTPSEVMARLLVSLARAEGDPDVIDAIRVAADLSGLALPAFETLDDLERLTAHQPGLWG